MIILIAVAAFVSVALGVFAVVSQVEERATVRASLRQLGDYGLTTVRDRELRGPVAERVFAPLLVGLTVAGRRLTPSAYAARARRKLVLSGRPRPEDIDRFLAVRALTVAALPLVVVAAGLGLAGRLGWVLSAAAVLALAVGPDAVINHRVAQRQARICRELPDVCDLLTISVEAGLGFEQALDRAVTALEGPLSDELIRMLNEVRAGSDRATALRAVDARTDVAEVRSFVLAILQAETFGVSIGRTLRAQADELRIKRRQAVQERAQKAPVKMLLPMVFCIFPALFVVVLGPAVINVAHGFR